MYCYAALKYPAYTSSTYGVDAVHATRKFHYFDANADKVYNTQPRVRTLHWIVGIFLGQASLEWLAEAYTMQ